MVRWMWKLQKELKKILLQLDALAVLDTFNVAFDNLGIGGHKHRHSGIKPRVSAIFCVFDYVAIL